MLFSFNRSWGIHTLKIRIHDYKNGDYFCTLSREDTRRRIQILRVMVRGGRVIVTFDGEEYVLDLMDGPVNELELITNPNTIIITLNDSGWLKFENEKVMGSLYPPIQKENILKSYGEKNFSYYVYRENTCFISYSADYE